MVKSGTLDGLLRFHQPLLLLGQAAICLVSAYAAFVLRFDAHVSAFYQPHLRFVLLVWPPVKLAVFLVGGLGRGWWRYVSMPDLIRLAVGNISASALVWVITIAFGPPGFPRFIPIIDFLICFLLTGFVRISRRVHWEMSRAIEGDPGKSRTLVYGAGDAGVAILREIRQNPQLPYQVVGLLDDDPAKARASMQGVSVLGSGADLAAVAKKRNADTVLVAMPSATGTQMSYILQQCHDAGVRFKTVPSLATILTDVSLAAQIRDVAVEDLLGRSPVVLEHDRIRRRLAGATVMVTGAAGSIGSELCRQIARYEPAAIVGFESSESGLFHLSNEMAKAFPEVRFAGEIGNIQNQCRVHEVIHEHSPSMIFHAAAYKHVPLMERHAFEAVENNVFGTFNVATAALQLGVEDFVLISSDKAVRPANIMGATKRMAEFVILSLRGGATKFVAVRFGNVLGSNGSVVPMFKEQIVAGGPVTVTHPEMRRYFMTIPEASQLVLQASVMGRGGEVFVLDMGQPVKIVDLARNLILLSGLRPDEDIRIVFTGARPGEKLYEELKHLEEGTERTQHPKVRVYSAGSVRQPNVNECLDRLREACANRDTRALVATLTEAIPDYAPSDSLAAVQ